VAHMTYRRAWIDRLQSAKRQHVPRTVALSPIARRAPTISLDSREPVGKPKRRRRIAAFRHEREPLRVRDQIARNPHSLDQDAMLRQFVIETKTILRMADRVNP